MNHTWTARAISAALRLIAPLLAVTLALPACALEPGQNAPAFELPRATAGTARLEDYRGHWVYLDFWASWCGPCKQSFPWMNALQARLAARGLKVVSINLDKRAEDAARFLSRTPAQFDVLYDASGATPAAFSAKAMPTSYLISPQGKVALAHNGFREEERADLERQITQLMERP